MVVERLKARRIILSHQTRGRLGSIAKVKVFGLGEKSEDKIHVLPDWRLVGSPPIENFITQLLLILLHNKTIYHDYGHDIWTGDSGLMSEA